MELVEVEVLEALEVDSLEMDAVEVDALQVEDLEVEVKAAEVEALGEVSLILPWCFLLLLVNLFLHFFPSLNKNNMFCVKECY